MQAQQYERKAHVIRDMDENVVFEGKLDLGALGSLPSINAAKRESRKLQGGALGRGTLRVAP
jgi:hypothetical protein